jgi:hypothetical protein
LEGPCGNENLVAIQMHLFFYQLRIYEELRSIDLISYSFLGVKYVTQVCLVTVVDPRRLTRPLSVNSSTPHVETLSDLFTLSADRVFHRRAGSRDNM